MYKFLIIALFPLCAMADHDSSQGGSTMSVLCGNTVELIPFLAGINEKLSWSGKEIDNSIMSIWTSDTTYTVMKTHPRDGTSCVIGIGTLHPKV